MDAIGPEAGAITALDPPAPLPVPEAPERIGTDDTDAMAGLDPAGLDRPPAEEALADGGDEAAGAGEAASADVVDPSAAPADAAASDAAGGSEVVVAFTGPCWVDIRDATGDFKLFGEMGDGDRHELGGEPPYSLIIGNASAVQMEIGGAPFDVAAIARGNVARFTLDAATIAEVAGSGSDAANESSPD
jgi:cytoskeleton protein RodZ